MDLLCRIWDFLTFFNLSAETGVVASSLGSTPTLATGYGLAGGVKTPWARRCAQNGDGHLITSNGHDDSNVVQFSIYVHGMLMLIVVK